MDKKPVYTNVRIYYEIATEAFAEMEVCLEKGRRPKPNGEEGYIITYDPKHTSFKNALIAVVFADLCIDVLLYLLVAEKEGKKKAEEYDSKRKKNKKRLELLGCTDRTIFDLCKDCKDARNEIVHEYSFYGKDNIRVAQNEAIKAMSLLNKIVEFFDVFK